MKEVNNDGEQRPHDLHQGSLSKESEAFKSPLETIEVNEDGEQLHRDLHKELHISKTRINKGTSKESGPTRCNSSKCATSTLEICVGENIFLLVRPAIHQNLDGARHHS